MTKEVVPFHLPGDISNKLPTHINNYAATFYSKTIRYPAFERGLKALENTLKYAGIEGAGMIVEGEPGAGKTRLNNYFIRNFYQEYSINNKIYDDEVINLPIISIAVPGRPTMPRVIEKILDVANHVSPSHRSPNKHEFRLRTMIEEQNVRMLVLEEYQHLVRNEKYTRDTLNFIKVLADDHKLAIVFSGLPEGHKALEGHEELRERLSLYRVKLHHFTKEYSYQDYLNYLKTMNHILSNIGVRCCDLSSSELALRLLLVTHGNQRFITRIIMRLLLEYKEEKELKLHDFEVAYDLHRFNPHLGEFNPFAKASKIALIKSKIAEFETPEINNKKRK